MVQKSITLCCRNTRILIVLNQNLFRSTTPDIITRLLDNAAFVCVHLVGRFSKDFSEVRGLRSRGFQLQVERKTCTTAKSSKGKSDHNASVNSKHQHPPGDPRVLHSTAAPGPGFILDDLPWGPGFCISIKLCLVQ